jgi:hypothetical protein
MAELLRTGRIDEVDMAHVAEEIEALGGSEKAAVRFQLERLMMHLIEQLIQPERDGTSWRSSIVEARREIGSRIEISPSLQRDLETRLETYRRAAKDARYETGLSGSDLPERCPWTLKELLEGDPR